MGGAEASKEAAMEELGELLAEDMRFYPPTYWTFRSGKQLGMLILQGISQIFKDFRYHRQLVDVAETSQACVCMLEFSALVDEVPCQGVDLLVFNRDGLLQEFKVMVRPPAAGVLLKKKMQAVLEELFGGAS